MIASMEALARPQKAFRSFARFLSEGRQFHSPRSLGGAGTFPAIGTDRVTFVAETDCDDVDVRTIHVNGMPFRELVIKIQTLTRDGGGTILVMDTRLRPDAMVVVDGH
jgi:hypothetical protein